MADEGLIVVDSDPEEEFQEVLSGSDNETVPHTTNQNSLFNDVQVISESPITRSVSRERQRRQRNQQYRATNFNNNNNDDDDVQILDQRTAEVRWESSPIMVPNGVFFASTVVEEDDDDFDDEFLTGDEAVVNQTNRRFREYQQSRTAFAQRHRYGFRHFHQNRQFPGFITSLIPDIMDGLIRSRLQRGNIHNEGNDDITPDVWGQVAALENAELNRKFDSQKQHAEKYIKKAESSVENLPKDYSSKINKDVQMLCPLCGVVLGEGIPDNFKSLVQTEKEKKSINSNHELIDYDLSDVYNSKIQEFKCQAPYQLLPFTTETDRKLSRKVYYSKCGHVFCGRCVQRIGSRDNGNVQKRKRKKMIKNIHNPSVYAPTKCVAEGCGKRLVGGKFVEIYHST